MQCRSLQRHTMVSFFKLIYYFKISAHEQFTIARQNTSFCRITNVHAHKISKPKKKRQNIVWIVTICM